MKDEGNSSSVIVLSPELSANQMLEILAVEPDQKWNLNDPITLEGKGRQPANGLYYESQLHPERPIAEHVHALAQRLEPARGRFANLKRRFQSGERRGSVQLSVFTYRLTESIEFLLDTDDLAFFAEVCTSLRVSVVGDSEAIEGEP